MELNEFFPEQIKENIKKDISMNNDNEIFFVVNIDIESKKIKEYNLLARGNSNMVPAIINDLKPGSIIIHNHPSGDLTPSAADIRIASRTGNNGIGFAIINNQVNKINFIVEAKIPEQEIKLDKNKIISLFKTKGKLDQSLRDYEYRDQQVQVVERIIDSLNEHKPYLIEAGTGTGKSFAYLIPALYWSNINKDTVVVSTNTINLQEQLIEKDLVLLKKVLPFPFKAVLVKGRTNYVCKRKKQLLENRAAEIYDEDPEKKIELVRILNWLEETDTGSRSELNFIVSSDLWDELKSESDLCMRTNCSHFNKCFFMQARKEVFSADILIVNHHLLLSDAVLKEESSDNNLGILPVYKKLIVDEAHNLVEAATSHLGQPFYIAALNKYFQRLYHNKFSLIPRVRDKLSKLDDKQDYLKIIDNKIINQITKLSEISAQYYHFFDDLIAEKENKIRIVENVKNSTAWKEIEDYGENFLINIQKLGKYLNDLYQKILDLDVEVIYHDYEELLIELESFIFRCKLLANNLDFNLKARDSQYVFWIEKKGEHLINQEN
ncbi:MAG: DEAD/DEAH box helicase, partial [Halanaerobiales bacterium]